MATRARTAQQRDARELALTPPPDPYRGALADPFTVRTVTSLPAGPPELAGQRPLHEPATSGPSTAQHRPAAGTARATPVPATFAGILGIAMGLTLGLFGMVLLAYLSLQHSDGAPDRSFYRGTDSGYLVLALLNFGLALGCAVGGIMLLTGRLAGRIAMTVAGWTALILTAFWYLRGNVNVAAPLIMACAAAAMLTLAYHGSVTRWLGVLPSPQPSTHGED